MQVYLDSRRIAIIATKFFEQYHSDVVVREVTLEDNVWKVIVTLGLIDRQNKLLKIDATTGTIIEYSSADYYEKMVDAILAIGDAMRYVIITDEKGGHIFSKMKEGKAMLFKSKDQISMISSELRTLRELLKFHNDDLGQVRSVNIMREKVYVFIYFLRGLTICASCEYDISQASTIEISENVGTIIRKSMM